MMRRSLLTIGPLVFGLCLVGAGFLYEVQYADIPYQDPTTEQQAQYNHDSMIASRVMSAGAVLVLAGSLLLIYRLIGSVLKRRDGDLSWRRTTLKYLEAKRAFIDGLSRDVDAHETGRYEEVGAGFDDLEAALPLEDGPEFDKLFIALNFWDGWIDSRNHNWLYYKGIKQSDWPVLAKRIVKSLEADQEISEPTVLRHFDLRASEYSKGPIRRLLERLWK